MLLHNLNLVKGRRIDIQVSGGVIKSITDSWSPAGHDIIELDLNGATVLPGLINSHDHLDFNLFPSFGNRRYSNYRQWGPYVHERYKAEIDKVLAVPQQLRTRWGMYKNLLAGVTTVAEHGEDDSITGSDLINLIRDQHCLHSVGFGKRWRQKLNHPVKRKLPAVMHVGEGIDEVATGEISTLLNWNLLKRDVIGVHGVAMTAAQAMHFKALVWCPQSNDFLFGQTADIKQLKKTTPILFGTDSTLTSHWNIWHHLRQARMMGQLDDGELLASLTTAPAMVWSLNNGEIAETKDADLLVIKPGISLFDTNSADIMLVVRKGNIVFFDDDLQHQLLDQGYPLEDFDAVRIAGSIKYVRGNIIELMADIKRYYPEANFPVQPV